MDKTIKKKDSAGYRNKTAHPLKQLLKSFYFFYFFSEFILKYDESTTENGTRGGSVAGEHSASEPTMPFLLDFHFSP